MGLNARRANKRSVLITDVHISGADCTYGLDKACTFPKGLLPPIQLLTGIPK